ncbi:hypothetical protein BGZ63DRAFT_384563 [Mariannaea sp. PMI_226]|nr:hypothetical protein BGZ63DRAFT_384563 [Mariannaea sp. PMI_226]
MPNPLPCSSLITCTTCVDKNYSSLDDVEKRVDKNEMQETHNLYLYSLPFLYLNGLPS